MYSLFQQQEMRSDYFHPVASAQFLLLYARGFFIAKYRKETQF